MSRRIRLADIAARLPAEARYWLTLMDAASYESTETVMNYCGVENFIAHWRHHQAALEKIQYDFDVPWPQNAFRSI
jgi:hypothetical protein